MYQIDGMVAIDMHPEEGHEWDQVANMHARCCWINANVHTYIFPVDKFLEVLSGSVIDGVSQKRDQLTSAL
jgi:hypothetical protein